jgi:hypothetical protein
MSVSPLGYEKFENECLSVPDIKQGCYLRLHADHVVMECKRVVAWYNPETKNMKHGNAVWMMAWLFTTLFKKAASVTGKIH